MPRPSPSRGLRLSPALWLGLWFRSGCQPDNGPAPLPGCLFIMLQPSAFAAGSCVYNCLGAGFQCLAWNLCNVCWVTIGPFLIWSATLAARKCTWLILPGILYVTNARTTKALTYSSCSVDVILSQTSMCCMTANASSPTAVLPLSKGVKNFASVWNFWAALVPQHTAPSGSCCKKWHRTDWWNVPFTFGWTQHQL